MRFWASTVFFLSIILSGAAGLFLAINILAPSKEEHTFSELTFDDSRKEKVECLIEERICRLKYLIPTMQSELAALGAGATPSGPLLHLLASEDLSEEDQSQIKRSAVNDQNKPPKNDSVEIKRSGLLRKLEIAQAALNRSLAELNELRFFHKDSSASYYTNYLWIDRGKMSDLLNNNDLTQKAKKDALKFYLIDTSLASIQENQYPVFDSIGAQLNTPKNKVSFINKYPLFGFWLVFSIGQMTMWFVTAVIIIGTTWKVLVAVRQEKSVGSAQKINS